MKSIDSKLPVATVNEGQLRGTRTGSVACFKRIPYAANPFTVTNRFKAPQPVAPWQGVRNACSYGPMPPQPSRESQGGLAGAADDLTLNIWTPVNSYKAPVLVWFPGGAFYRVDASETWYDGTSFASQGIVVVTVNYRVGIDGFMAIDGMPCNRGLLDQVAALQWIQHNISAFGGNPADVTIAGQSAGAQSVMSLLGMPKAKGMFKQAIAQSPPQNTLTVEQANIIAKATAEQLGIQPTAAAMAEVPLSTLITCVEKMITDLDDRSKWGEIGGQPPFLPVIDGEVLVSRPCPALSQREQNIPLLIGCTDEEWRLFTVPGNAIDDTSQAEFQDALYRNKLPSTAVPVYTSTRENASPGDCLASLRSDETFRMPTLRYAENQVAAGAPVWFYHFCWKSPGFGGRLGAGHVVDVPYSFNTLSAKEAIPIVGDQGYQPLADTMHAHWTRFVQTGDAGWPVYDLENRPTMQFDITTGLAADPLADRRMIWT